MKLPFIYLFIFINSCLIAQDYHNYTLDELLENKLDFKEIFKNENGAISVYKSIVPNYTFINEYEVYNSENDSSFWYNLTTCIVGSCGDYIQMHTSNWSDQNFFNIGFNTRANFKKFNKDKTQFNLKFKNSNQKEIFQFNINYKYKEDYRLKILSFKIDTLKNDFIKFNLIIKNNSQDTVCLYKNAYSIPNVRKRYYSEDLYLNGNFEEFNNTILPSSIDTFSHFFNKKNTKSLDHILFEVLRYYVKEDRLFKFGYIDPIGLDMPQYMFYQYDSLNYNFGTIFPNENINYNTNFNPKLNPKYKTIIRFDGFTLGNISASIDNFSNENSKFNLYSNRIHSGFSYIIDSIAYLKTYKEFGFSKNIPFHICYKFNGSERISISKNLNIIDNETVEVSFELKNNSNDTILIYSLASFNNNKGFLLPFQVFKKRMKLSLKCNNFLYKFGLWSYSVNNSQYSSNGSLYMDIIPDSLRNKYCYSTIKIDSSIIRLGKIKKHSRFIYKFKVYNSGTDYLLLPNCNGPGCCVLPICPREPIMPGKSAEVSVFVSTDGVGIGNKSVTLSSNAKDNPRLIIQFLYEIIE